MNNQRPHRIISSINEAQLHDGSENLDPQFSIEDNKYEIAKRSSKDLLTLPSTVPNLWSEAEPIQKGKKKTRI